MIRRQKYLTFNFLVFNALLSLLVHFVSPQEGNVPTDRPFLNQTRATKSGGAAAAQKNKFTMKATTNRLNKVYRTTPMRVSFEESCDYLAYYCLKAYNTGRLCARTLYYTYHTFKNYCLMDYINCMERYEVWQVVHMGECFNITELTEYLQYPYDDDFWLDEYYIFEDH